MRVFHFFGSKGSIAPEWDFCDGGLTPGDSNFRGRRFEEGEEVAREGGGGKWP